VRRMVETGEAADLLRASFCVLKVAGSGLRIKT
jgi:hypothetical protein